MKANVNLFKCGGVWWNKPLKKLKLATFNARVETVATKPFFRSAFKRTRCLIPASGYYEWQNTPNGKQPYYFNVKSAGAMVIVPSAMASFTEQTSVTIATISGLYYAMDRDHRWNAWPKPMTRSPKR